jgi:hypothetical protein
MVGLTQVARATLRQLAHRKAIAAGKDRATAGVRKEAGAAAVARQQLGRMHLARLRAAWVVVARVVRLQEQALPVEAAAGVVLML